MAMRATVDRRPRAQAVEGDLWAREIAVERQRRGLDAPAEHVALSMRRSENGDRLFRGITSRDDERRINGGDGKILDCRGSRRVTHAHTAD